MISGRLPREAVKRYAIAGFLVLTAVALEMVLRPLFRGRAPLTVFALAITFAASQGGLGPGLLATGLSLGSVQWLFATAVFSILPGRPNLWIFGGLGCAISFVIESFRRRNAALSRAKDLLEAANKEIEQRSVELAYANEELKRFAYALSHDLKSPIRTVSLFTERLAGTVADKLDDDAATSMRFILDSARQAQDMIHRLLDYSVAVHQKRTEATTNLETVLVKALEDVWLAAQESGTRITHDPMPEIVQADGEPLRQVFMNLLTNAIKYRNENSPEIHVAARIVNGEWVISVRDNGIGIDPKYGDKIFGLFERLHSSKQYEGTGVGLALCRAIIQRHGGRIWVESELGRGSAFCFTLPVHQQKSAPGNFNTRSAGSLE